MVPYWALASGRVSIRLAVVTIRDCSYAHGGSATMVRYLLMCCFADRAFRVVRPVPGRDAAVGALRHIPVCVLAELPGPPAEPCAGVVEPISHPHHQWLSRHAIRPVPRHQEQRRFCTCHHISPVRRLTVPRSQRGQVCDCSSSAFATVLRTFASGIALRCAALCIPVSPAMGTFSPACVPLFVAVQSAGSSRGDCCETALACGSAVIAFLFCDCFLAGWARPRTVLGRDPARVAAGRALRAAERAARSLHALLTSRLWFGCRG
jgi:hypothetical protein